MFYRLLFCNLTFIIVLLEKGYECDNIFTNPKNPRIQWNLFNFLAKLISKSRFE